MAHKIEAIRGKIRCTEVEIRLPAKAMRMPGWIRMEPTEAALAEVGLAIEGADRIQTFPEENGMVLVRFFDFGDSGRNTGQYRRMA